MSKIGPSNDYLAFPLSPHQFSRERHIYGLEDLREQLFSNFGIIQLEFVTSQWHIPDYITMPRPTTRLSGSRPSLTNIDPQLRRGAGGMVAHLESLFEGIVDSMSRNEEMHIDLASASSRQRNPGDVR